MPRFSSQPVYNDGGSSNKNNSFANNLFNPMSPTKVVQQAAQQAAQRAAQQAANKGSSSGS